MAAEAVVASFVASTGPRMTTPSGAKSGVLEPLAVIQLVELLLRLIFIRSFRALDVFLQAAGAFSTAHNRRPVLRRYDANALVEPFLCPFFAFSGPRSGA